MILPAFCVFQSYVASTTMAFRILIRRNILSEKRHRLFFSAYLGGGQKKDVPSAVGSRVNNIKANGGQSNTIALMLFTPKALFVCSSFCLPTQNELSVSSLLLK